jgi:hypothetical protein
MSIRFLPLCLLALAACGDNAPIGRDAASADAMTTSDAVPGSDAPTLPDAATLPDATPGPDAMPPVYLRVNIVGDAPGQVAAYGDTYRLCTTTCDVEIDPTEVREIASLEIGTPGRLGEVSGATCDGRHCVVMAGTAEVTVRFDATPEQRFSTLLPLDARLVSVDWMADGAILVGTGSATLVLEADGALRWRSDAATGEARQTPSGAILVLNEAGITRLTGDGELEWARPMEGDDDVFNPMARALAPAADDGAFIAGYRELVRIDADGEAVWSQSLFGGRQAVALRGAEVLTGAEGKGADPTDLFRFGLDGALGSRFEHVSNQYAFSFAVDTTVPDGDIVTVSAGHSRIWLDRYADDMTALLQDHWYTDSDSYVDVGVAVHGPRTTVVAGTGEVYGYIVRAYDRAELVWTLDAPGDHDDVGWSAVEPRDVAPATGNEILIGGTYSGPATNMAWVAVIGPPAL